MIEMINKATNKDVNAIYSLIDSAAKRSRLLPRTKEEIKEVVNGFYIFEQNNKIVGCCSLEIYNKKMAEIRSLAVMPEHQNQGIAIELIRTCVKEAKEKGINKVFVITDKINIFERLGFASCLNNQTALFFKP